MLGCRGLQVVRLLWSDDARYTAARDGLQVVVRGVCANCLIGRESPRSLSMDDLAQGFGSQAFRLNSFSSSSCAYTHPSMLCLPLDRVRNFKRQ
eukprot:5301713-Prymnesium_polylepis.1